MYNLGNFHGYNGGQQAIHQYHRGCGRRIFASEIPRPGTLMFLIYLAVHTLPETYFLCSIDYILSNFNKKASLDPLIIPCRISIFIISSLGRTNSFESWCKSACCDSEVQRGARCFRNIMTAADRSPASSFSINSSRLIMNFIALLTDSTLIVTLGANSKVFDSISSCTFTQSPLKTFDLNSDMLAFSSWIPEIKMIRNQIPAPSFLL